MFVIVAEGSKGTIPNGRGLSDRDAAIALGTYQAKN